MSADAMRDAVAGEENVQAEADERAMFDEMTRLMLDAWGKRVQEVIFYARAVAKSHGYALAVHGSLRRDIDVVAVPWVADVSPAAEMARDVFDSLTRGGYAVGWGSDGEAGEAKPHGRHGWAIVLAGEPFCYLDFSVIAPHSTLLAALDTAQRERDEAQDLLDLAQQEAPTVEAIHRDEARADALADAVRVVEGLKVKRRPTSALSHLALSFDDGHNAALDAAVTALRASADHQEG